MRKTILLIISFMSLLSYTNAQWQQTNFPYTGAIYCLAVKGTDMYAGTDTAGVFLSSNNGKSWNAMNIGLPTAEIGIFSETGGFFKVTSLVTSGTNIFAGTESGAFLLTNNDTSWSSVNEGLPNSMFINAPIYSLALKGTNIYSATYGTFDCGVYLSTDNGANWSAVNTGIQNQQVRALTVNGTSIFAGTEDGMFLSTNNGLSWTEVNNGIPDNTTVWSLASNGANIFAGTYLTGVFLSTNSGTSWNAVNTGLTDRFVHSLTVYGENIFAGTSDGVFLSANNGSSWRQVNNGIPPKTSVYSIAICGSDIFVGTLNNGVWKCSLEDIMK